MKKIVNKFLILLGILLILVIVAKIIFILLGWMFALIFVILFIFGGLGILLNEI